MGDAARILVVCTGNICRSPFIERLLQLRIGELRPIADWPVEVSSAGTRALAGWDMDERVAERLVALGGDASGFRARQLTADLIADADLILTATRAHRSQVGKMSPLARRRIFALRDFAGLLSESHTLHVGPPPTDAREWVAQVAETMASRRGLTTPLDQAEVDVVDPFARKDKTVAKMAEQVASVMPDVARALMAER